jgi:hypothetical protein
MRKNIRQLGGGGMAQLKEELKGTGDTRTFRIIQVEVGEEVNARAQAVRAKGGVH